MQNIMIDKVINEAFVKVIDESNDPVLQTLYKQYKEITGEYVPDRRADAFAQYDKNKLKEQIKERLYSLHKPALVSLICMSVNMIAPSAEAGDIRSSMKQASTERLVSRVKDAATKSLETKANRSAAIKKILATQKKANEHPKVNVSRKQGIQAALEKMKKGMAEREIASHERMSSLQKRSPEINKIVAEMRNMGLTNDLLALIHEDDSVGN